MGNAMSAMSREEREDQRQRDRLAMGGKALVNRDALLRLVSSIDAIGRIDPAKVEWVDHDALESLRQSLF